MNKVRKKIQDLVSKNRRVPHWKKPRSLMIFWFLFNLVYLAFLIVMSSHAVVVDARLYFPPASIFLATTLILWRASVPGISTSKNFWLVPVILFVGWGGLIVGYQFTGFASIFERAGFSLRDDWVCARWLISVTVVPLATAILLLRGLAPQRLRWTGFLAFLMAAAGCALSLEILCPIQTIPHKICGHYGVVLLFGFLGYLAGEKLFKW